MCRRSPHAEETPEARAEPEQRPATSVPVPVPVPPVPAANATADDAKARCARCRQDSSAATTPRARRRRRRTFPAAAKTRSRADDPADPTPCRSVATRVREKFTEAENRDDARVSPGTAHLSRAQEVMSCVATISTSSCGYRRAPGGGTTRSGRVRRRGVRKRTQSERGGGKRGRLGRRAVRRSVGKGGCARHGSVALVVEGGDSLVAREGRGRVEGRCRIARLIVSPPCGAPRAKFASSTANAATAPAVRPRG